MHMHWDGELQGQANHKTRIRGRSVPHRVSETNADFPKNSGNIATITSATYPPITLTVLLPFRLFCVTVAHSFFTSRPNGLRRTRFQSTPSDGNLDLQTKSSAYRNTIDLLTMSSHLCFKLRAIQRAQQMVQDQAQESSSRQEDQQDQQFLV
jgi:hypothetical protein